MFMWLKAEVKETMCVFSLHMEPVSLLLIDTFLWEDPVLYGRFETQHLVSVSSFRGYILQTAHLKPDGVTVL